MPPINPNNTTRYFLDYSVDGQQHTLEMRCDPGVTDAEASTHIGDFLGAMAPLIAEATIVRLRRAEAGSNVSLPATWSGDASYGTGGPTAENVPLFFSFTGKGPSGHRVRVTLFGNDIGVNADYRIAEGADLNVAAALAELRTTDPVWININGDAPIWNSYVNLGFNAYWQRQARL